MSSIIGFSGFAGAGKDAAATCLIQEGYTRIAFADVLRDMAYALDPLVLEQTDDERGEFYIFRRLQDVIDDYGWDFAKNNFLDVRRTLQRLGTEAGRDILGENIWVDTALGRVENDKIVVTDVRFPNEAKGIKARGGRVVRIERRGVGPRNDHPSETSLIDYDFDLVIENFGTVEELHQKVRKELL